MIWGYPYFWKHPFWGVWKKTAPYVFFQFFFPQPNKKGWQKKNLYSLASIYLSSFFSGTFFSCGCFLFGNLWHSAPDDRRSNQICYPPRPRQSHCLDSGFPICRWKMNPKKTPSPGDSSRDLFAMVKRDPFKWLSDLQLRDEKVTLNHLDWGFSYHPSKGDSRAPIMGAAHMGTVWEAWAPSFKVVLKLVGGWNQPIWKIIT